VVPFRDDASAHWQGGGAIHEYIDPFTVDSIGPVQNPQSSTSGLPKNLTFPPDESGSNPDPGFTTATTFSVYGHFVANPLAWSPERAQARALDVLLAYEERAVEKNFWFGSLGNTPALVQNQYFLGNVAVSGNPALMTQAVGMLEKNIADYYGSQGVIHMNRLYAIQLLTNDTIRVVGTHLETALGTPVIAGSGYPTGEIRGGPAIYGYRGDVFTSSERRGDLLDKTVNNLYAIAERTYLLGMDPYGVGVVTFS
jgi:hypothetical protein